MTDRNKMTIKAARVNKGYTQDEVSALIGISKRTISAWENNRVPVPKYALFALAYVYEMKVDQFEGYSTVPTTQP